MSTMAARSRARAGNLTAAAAGRLNIVQARIDGLRRKAEYDPAAAEEYRALLEETPARLRANPARGHIDVARLVYVAETDEAARRDSEAGILRHLAHFSSGHASGYLGTVQEKTVGDRSGYVALALDIILHGSPETVAEKIAHLRDAVGATSIMVHYPPWYGIEKALASLELFATEVAPKFRTDAHERLRA